MKKQKKKPITAVTTVTQVRISFLLTEAITEQNDNCGSEHLPLVSARLFLPF